jgi:hypothetical protein
MSVKRYAADRVPIKWNDDGHFGEVQEVVLATDYDAALAVLRGCVELIASAGPLAWIANENWDGARSWEVASDSILAAARKLLEEET